MARHAHLRQFDHCACTPICFVTRTRPIVEIQAKEGECNTDSLQTSGWTAEPYNGQDNDPDAFNQTGDGIGDGRDHGEENESKNILTPVKGAIEEKLQGEGAVVQRSVLERDGASVDNIVYQDNTFGPEPDRERHGKRKTGRVA